MELEEKTRLSSRTLAKHLTEMTDSRIIERMRDIRSGKYPVPILYKAVPEVADYVRTLILQEEAANHLVLALDETKDPLAILDAIHATSQIFFLDIINEIQQDKNISEEKINIFADTFILRPYREYTLKLIKASQKMIDEFNVNQLLINQAKRQIEVSKTCLEIYENTGRS